MAFLKGVGQSPDFADPDLWRCIPELVAAERTPEEGLSDAPVVDEGQDFEAEWPEVLRLRRYTGAYDADGNQVLTPGQLTFESVYHFKGQEAPAVFLVDVDPAADRLEREERLLYCGMTRATVRLDLVVRADNPANRRFLES